MLRIDDIQGKVKDVIYLEDISNEMDNSFKNGYKKADTTHFISLDNHFRILKKNLIIFGGIGNYGKSKFARNILVNRAVKNGQKFGIFCPEDMPEDYFYNDLIHTYIGKSPFPFHHNQMTKEEYDKGKEFIKDHFYLVNPENPTSENMQIAIKELKNIHNIDGFLIDPFNQMLHDWGDRDDKYLERFLIDYKRLAVSEDIYMMFVVHTNSSVKLTNDGNYDIPKVFNIANGAMWNNKADDIVFIHRPYRNSDPKDNTTTISIQKIKKQIICGVPDNKDFIFDIYENRYKENNGQGLTNPLEILKQENNIDLELKLNEIK